jgi:tRNA (guanine-N7-)-methyltransferase
MRARAPSPLRTPQNTLPHPLKQQHQQATAVLPRKRFYRTRAHSNPLNAAVGAMRVPAAPPPPERWAAHFPAFFAAHQQQQQGHHPPQPLPEVRFADVGCGFGGLLVRLATLYPDKLALGLELRDKVAAYVRERVLALRHVQRGLLKERGQEEAVAAAAAPAEADPTESPVPGGYENISVLRANAMRHLPNYFRARQLEKLFFCFPDPHFKASNRRRRIVSVPLLAEYAHLVAPGGRVYTITDVPELGAWMRAQLEAHPSFVEVSAEELARDAAANLLPLATEEGQKVARNGGQTFIAVFERV